MRLMKGNEIMAKPEKSTPASAGEKDLGGLCSGKACKKDQKKFGFCMDHFDQFKFGLIKKDGNPVSDYEKKFGQYQAYLKRQGVQKVA